MPQESGAQLVVGCARLAGRRLHVGEAAGRGQLAGVTLQRTALARSGGIVGLHHEDRGSPRARIHVTRVTLQRALEVLHAACEVVAVLPQQAAREEDLGGCIVPRAPPPRPPRGTPKTPGALRPLRERKTRRQAAPPAPVT